MRKGGSRYTDEGAGLSGMGTSVLFTEGKTDRQNWKGGAGKEREGEFLMAFVFSTKQEAG